MSPGRTEMIWMGHAGHFICGRECQFRLNTYVNGFIVSTLGELKYRGDRDEAPFRALGADKDSLYETMVFHARKTNEPCCPYEQVDGSDLDSMRYATAGAAYEGHLAMLKKWARKSEFRRVSRDDRRRGR